MIAREHDRTARLEAIRTRVVAGILALLVIAGLQASYAVTMPLAAAVIIIAAIWPLKRWLDQMLSSTVSYPLVILALLLISACFFGAVYFSMAQVVNAFAERQEQFNSIYASIGELAARWGLQDVNASEGYRRLIGVGQQLLSNLYSIVAYLGLVLILVVLGMLEVAPLAERLKDALDVPERQKLIATVEEIGDQVRRYAIVTTITSAMTGVASSVWAFAVGLELAVVWGVLNFLLNFIPVVGNFVGIIPPTLFALIQFQSASWMLVVLIGFAIIQIVISNVIYPMLQGRSLSLSPVVILVALAFWSWVWGIAGALLAVPMTAAVVILCAQYRGTEWIAMLLSDHRRDDHTRSKG